MLTLRQLARRGINAWHLYSSYVLIKSGLRKFFEEKLELGSGPTRRPGWVTVDMSSAASVFWDLRYPTPFADNSFSLVYSSHVLEHFSYDQLIKLLDDIYRVLKPGGTVSICVPDARIYIDLYNSKADPGDLIEYTPAGISSQPMDTLNYMFYMAGEHRHMFDPASLIHHLQARGFTQCVEREFDPALDMPERQRTSFYVECRKAA